jgi:prepilin-type N-terminal cleavage/methylation domain-containing protein
VDRNATRGFTFLELMMVLGVMAVLLAIAVPRMATFRGTNDVHDLSNNLSLAKLKAASTFTQARLYIDLAGRTHHVDWWQKGATPGWVALNGPTLLTNGEAFTFGPVGTPPANSQPAIAQAPACLDNTSKAIGATACVVFNSRGIPVDVTGTPTNADAVYVSDGTVVGAVTVSTTGLITVWTTPSTSTPTWAHK